MAWLKRFCKINKSVTLVHIHIKKYSHLLYIDFILFLNLIKNALLLIELICCTVLPPFFFFFEDFILGQLKIARSTIDLYKNL